MQLGLHLVTWNWLGGPPRIGETLGRIVESAEAAGFDSIDVSDHVWQSKYTGGELEPQLEGWTTLAWIAARTERVRLFTLATAATYREPALLAKMATTLDVLSGGRLMLGLGAGDDEAEANGLGLPYGSAAERFDRLEDTLRICLAMWQGERGADAPFEGRTVTLGRTLNVPQPLTRPHPPILVAGGGERRTLPLVARYADACNIPPSPELPRKLDLVRRLCDEAGRDYDAIEKTVPFGFDVGEDGQKVDELLRQLEWLASMGAQSVFGWLVGVERERAMDIMARRVIPEAAGMGAPITAH